MGLFSINLNEPIKVLWNKVTKAEEKKKIKEYIFKIKVTLQSSITKIELCKYKFEYFDYSQLEFVLPEMALDLDNLASYLSENLNYENVQHLYDEIQKIISKIKEIVQDLKLRTYEKHFTKDIINLIEELKKARDFISSLLSEKHK